MTTTLPSPHDPLIDRDRRRAVVSSPPPAPGRYLGVHIGDETIVLPLENAVIVLGRGLGCDIRFDDPTLSRRHAMIIDRDGTAVLADDRSTNGTWLNDERVSEAVLRHGDTIVLGAVRLDYIEPALDDAAHDGARAGPVPPRAADTDADADADAHAATTLLTPIEKDTP